MPNLVIDFVLAYFRRGPIGHFCTSTTYVDEEKRKLAKLFFSFNKPCLHHSPISILGPTELSLSSA